MERILELARYIDHTNLKPDAIKQDIVKLCEEAKKYNFYSVCVNPSYTSLALEQTLDSDVKVCSVIGFPLGAVELLTKGFEAKNLSERGVHELDMVINIAALKNSDFDYVLNEIKYVVEVAGPELIVKVIIETCLLSESEKIQACKLSEQAGAHFVKTSTGFSTGGATVADLKLMRKTVEDRMKIKASGGIRTKEVAIQMIEAGANRIGTSSSLAIIGVI